jgi:hypothetical protein
MKDGQTIGQWLKWDFETNGDLEIKAKNGRLNYYELSNGFWSKWELDSQGNEIYWENPSGIIIDNRPPEVIEHNGHKYQLMS